MVSFLAELEATGGRKLDPGGGGRGPPQPPTTTGAVSHRAAQPPGLRKIQVEMGGHR